jgi:hypothetical protein
MTLPRGARMRARCDASRLLVTVAPTSAQGAAALFTFERGASPATTLVEPPPGGVTDVHAMLLVRRAVLAVVSSAGAVRAWRYVAGDALGVQSNRWEPGGLVMDLVPAARVRRAVTQAQAQGRDDEVTLLLDLAQAPRVIAQTIPDQPMSPFEERPARQWSPAGLAVFVSHDGGLTFGPPGPGALRPIPR